MKRKCIILIASLLYFVMGSSAQDLEIVIAFNPSDCLSCSMPIREVIFNADKNNVTLITKEVPKNVLKQYTSQLLQLDDSVKVLSSSELFNQFSYFGASSICLIDRSVSPPQKFVIPINQYYKYKSVLYKNEELNWPDSLTQSTEGIVHGDFGKINSIVAIDSSSVLVHDGLLNSVQKFSVNSGEPLAELQIDSLWYIAPFKTKPTKADDILNNQPALQKISYPQYQFKGVFRNSGNIIVSTLCYYPYSAEDAVEVLSRYVFYSIDSLLNPINFKWIFVDEPSPIANLNYAIDFEDGSLRTTVFYLEKGKVSLSDSMIHQYKSIGDSLVYDFAFNTGLPEFLGNKNIFYGSLIKNSIASNKSRKIMWFTYYPEFYDLNYSQWKSIDTTFVDHKEMENSFDMNSKSQFEILHLFPAEANKYEIIAQFGRNIYYIEQNGDYITQSWKLYTMPERSEFYIEHFDEDSYVAIEHDKEAGSAKFIRLTISKVKLF